MYVCILYNIFIIYLYLIRCCCFCSALFTYYTLVDGTLRTNVITIISTRIFSHREKYFIGPLCRLTLRVQYIHNNRRTMNNNDTNPHATPREPHCFLYRYTIFMHTIMPFQFSTDITLSLFPVSLGQSTIVRLALRFFFSLLYNTYALLFSLFISFVYRSICVYKYIVCYIRTLAFI